MTRLTSGLPVRRPREAGRDPTEMCLDSWAPSLGTRYGQETQAVKASKANIPARASGASGAQPGVLDRASGALVAGRTGEGPVRSPQPALEGTAARMAQGAEGPQEIQ